MSIAGNGPGIWAPEITRELFSDSTARTTRHLRELGHKLQDLLAQLRRSLLPCTVACLH